MGKQRHIVKRQVVELQVANAADASSLQAEVSRIYRQRIVLLIDRCCTELSDPDLIHRIDSLELNLGQIDPRHLEEDLVARTKTSLRRLLADEIRKNRRQTETSSRLELFSLFVRTGSLPWWADSSRPQLLDECLQSLVRTASPLLRRTLRELVQGERYLQRMIQHFTDEGLADLVETLAPPFKRFSLVSLARDIVTTLRKIGIVIGVQEKRVRTLVWSVALHQAAANSPERPTGASLSRAILERVAREIGIPYAELLSSMRENDESGKRRTIDTETTAAPGQFPAGRNPAALLRFFRTLAGRLPPESRGQVLAALDRINLSAADADALEELIRLLRSEPGRRLLSQAVGHRLLTELESLTVAGFSPEQVSDLTAFLQRVMNEAEELEIADKIEPIDLSFSDSGELYVDNAGLVLLGPFLVHFFSRLDLISDKQFKDVAARQRAVGLLQYVATEDASPQEYLLALNKVLCGMEPDEVFDFGPELTETEAEECANLLNAVIVNAPVLENMSIAGFRGTFLLRRGVLSRRDGMWLLRVERETYDIVLDRLPWTVQWVKLPWIDGVMQIEW